MFQQNIDFSEVFDVPEFTGEEVQFETDRRSNYKMSSTGGRIALRKRKEPKAKSKYSSDGEEWADSF